MVLLLPLPAECSTMGVVADAFAPGRLDQQAHRLKLVVAGEDHRLGPRLPPALVALLAGLQVDEPRQAGRAGCRVRGPPPTGTRCGSCAPAGRAGCRRPRRTPGRRAGKRVAAPASRVVIATDSVSAAKWTSARPLEREDRLTGVAVLPVLRARVLDRLPGQRVLELHRDDRHPVHAQHHVERLLRARREAQLAGDANPVRGVARPPAPDSARGPP